MAQLEIISSSPVAYYVGDWPHCTTAFCQAAVESHKVSPEPPLQTEKSQYLVFITGEKGEFLEVIYVPDTLK